MTEFKRVTPDFAVAPQLSPEDIARAAADGFIGIINNRPDGEAPGQMTAAVAEAAATAAGLKFWNLPFTMPPTPGVVAETASVLEAAGGPVLGYCRTGTRSVSAWAMAQVSAGRLSPDQAVGLAERAGYDLSGARGVLDRLAPD